MIHYQNYLYKILDFMVNIKYLTNRFLLHIKYFLETLNNEK